MQKYHTETRSTVIRLEFGSEFLARKLQQSGGSPREKVVLRRFFGSYGNICGLPGVPSRLLAGVLGTWSQRGVVTLKTIFYCQIRNYSKLYFVRIDMRLSQ